MSGPILRVRRVCYAVCFAFAAALSLGASFSESQESAPRSGEWRFQLRHRSETSPSSGRFHTLVREEIWRPEKTAIIVCDVWDSHHSINAVRRVGEIAPRIDLLLKQARAQGATIIHAPSDCMNSYTEHPARHRAMNVPSASSLPAGMKSWRSRIDSEIGAVYPVDQSDGGDDDDPIEHAPWVKELQSQGRTPGTPWLAQSPMIAIDPEVDFISDQGDEVWNVLQSRGIDNIVLVGVHTNMCVLGRPFGLRNMVAAGKNVALVRDLTDTMYNPRRWPFVNHHTGTDRIIEYIEKYICPTLTSDQFLGGQPLRFTSDKRPLAAIVMAEDEYETNQTLSDFAENFLGDDFRVALVFASEKYPNDIPGLEILDNADVAIISVRRRPLAQSQLEIVRRFVESGKPILGIRTASHAFVPREMPPPEGLEAWPEFDSQVFGGNYSGHHGHTELPLIEVVPQNATNAILTGIEPSLFKAGGSLYKTSPVDNTAQIILRGSIPGQPAEPVAWTFVRRDGGKSFYTSLGQKQDFENSAFTRLLVNALCWATDKEIKMPSTSSTHKKIDPSHWRLVSVPGNTAAQNQASNGQPNGKGWYRCYFKLAHEDIVRGIQLTFAQPAPDAAVWLNGQQVPVESVSGGYVGKVQTGWASPGELNLLVICLAHDRNGESFTSAPILWMEKKEWKLEGRWQFCGGDDSSNATLPLPAKFAASTDVIFE